MSAPVIAIVLVVWTAPAANRLGPIRDLPDIGLRIAMPDRMTDLPLDRLTDWVRAGVAGEDEDAGCDQILVLSALPPGARHDAKTAAAEWVRAAERQRTEYKVLSQRPAKWQAEGWEVLATYKVDERNVTSLQWFGWRKGPPVIVYVLTYDVVEGRAEAMRTVLGTVAGSCETTPIRPASTQPVRLGRRQFLPKRGLSLQVPTSLRMMVPNREGMLVRAGTVDYLRDRLLPVLSLTTNEVKAAETPEARLKRSLDHLTPALKPSDGQIESQGPAKVGDRQAHQVCLALTKHRERLMTAIRLAIWRDKALVLSLTYPAANAKELGEAMDRVAGSFQFEP